MALQHLRSSTADKRPTPAAMSDGQLALNTNLVSPGLFFKDSNGDSVKIGPVHVGTTAPNVTPGAGGQAGNSKGEAWLDTTATNPILKVWNGSAFVAVQPVGTGTVVSTTDTGTVTSTMILDGTILNADINASAAIVDTKLATISTAGKVSNSATTADSANTASAIVARDASGNFAAGDITIGDKIIHAGDTDTAIRFPAADTVSVETIGTERMRINNVGNLLIGTTVALNPSTTTDSGFRCTQAGAVTISRSASPPLALQRTGAVGNVVVFYSANTTVGTISVTASATAYNTSSDYRLKENITLLDGAIARLNQLPVHRFNFIADPDTVVDGFIAHEAAAVVPECVTGEKDEEDENGDPVYQGIDQSKVVPLLTAALQEAIAMIGALEARVAALELN
jgi:hypothetical protein